MVHSNEVPLFSVKCQLLFGYFVLSWKKKTNLSLQLYLLVKRIKSLIFCNNSSMNPASTFMFLEIKYLAAVADMIPATEKHDLSNNNKLQWLSLRGDQFLSRMCSIVKALNETHECEYVLTLHHVVLHLGLHQAFWALWNLHHPFLVLID